MSIYLADLTHLSALGCLVCLFSQRVRSNNIPQHLYFLSQPIRDDGTVSAYCPVYCGACHGVSPSAAVGPDIGPASSILRDPQHKGVAPTNWSTHTQLYWFGSGGVRV